MPSKNHSRNHRNNPYALDGLAVQIHRSAAGVIWRARTELTTLLATACGLLALTHALTATWAAVILAVLVIVIAVLPWTRRFVLRRAWCVISRHRLQRVCFETRMHTRSGRLPLILRIHPTEVGERATIWCRAGICFEDFEAHTGEIAAACYAREARVERSKRWAQIVRVDIVRRDTLAAHHLVTSGLAPKPPAAAKQKPAERDKATEQITA
jgi:hypothetical protein